MFKPYQHSWFALTTYVTGKYNNKKRKDELVRRVNSPSKSQNMGEDMLQAKTEEMYNITKDGLFPW